MVGTGVVVGTVVVVVGAGVVVVVVVAVVGGGGIIVDGFLVVYLSLHDFLPGLYFF